VIPTLLSIISRATHIACIVATTVALLLQHLSFNNEIKLIIFDHRFIHACMEKEEEEAKLFFLLLRVRCKLDLYSAKDCGILLSGKRSKKKKLGGVRPSSSSGGCEIFRNCGSGLGHF